MNKCRFIFRSLSKYNQIFNFTQKIKMGGKSNIFSDKYEMTPEEIDMILKKKGKNSQEETPKPDLETLKPSQKLTMESKPKPDEKLQKIFSQKINYEIPDSVLVDLERKKPDSEISKRFDEKTPTTKKEKYGLPIPNIEIPADPSFELEAEKLQETPNMRVMQLLNVNEETPYETYELELQKKFNFEMDMYGSVTNENEIRELQIKQLGEELIPMGRIQNESYMNNFRKYFTLNISMPGTLENEHPHKFLKNLRPIEEFRNTPLIPISDQMMQQHKERVEKYHRSGVYFEIKKESFLNMGVFVGAVCLMYMLLKFVSTKEEEASIAYQRLKLQRLREY